MKIKRQQEAGRVDNSASNRDKVLDKYLKDPSMSDVEKLEMVKKRAEAMEEKALRDEKLVKTTGVESKDGRVAIEKTIAVNDMYIEAIQAKLQLLEQI